LSFPRVSFGKLGFCKKLFGFRPGLAGAVVTPPSQNLYNFFFFPLKLLARKVLRQRRALNVGKALLALQALLAAAQTESDKACALRPQRQNTLQSLLLPGEVQGLLLLFVTALAGGSSWRP
jgi:hypothetical protein